MIVTLKQLEGVNFIATTESGHEISIDGSDQVGGQNRGARPMEIVLAGLGGCSSIDVMSILKKSRVDVADCKIEINAERADAVPSVFSKIHVHYIFSGNQLDQKKVSRAVSLSMEKYCSVTRMLEKTADITYDFEIIEN